MTPGSSIYTYLSIDSIHNINSTLYCLMMNFEIKTNCTYTPIPHPTYNI